jgi:hypothetical protein
LQVLHLGGDATLQHILINNVILKVGQSFSFSTNPFHLLQPLHSPGSATAATSETLQ